MAERLVGEPVELEELESRGVSRWRIQKNRVEYLQKDEAYPEMDKWAKFHRPTNL